MNSRMDARGTSSRQRSRFAKLQKSPRRRRLGSLRVIALATVLAAGGLQGCGAQPQAHETVSARQFQDVVVPAGLKLVDDAHESYSVEAASWRHARYLYSGSIRADDAMSYVRQRMPQHNWALAEEKKVDESTTRLRFVRGQYSAEYQFVHLDGRLQMQVDYSTDATTR